MASVLLNLPLDEENSHMMESMTSVTNEPLHKSNEIPKLPGFDLQAFMEFTTDPEKTQSILNVQKALVSAPNRAEMIQWAVKAIEDSPSFKALYEERYLPSFPTNDEFMKFPVGTLGRAIGEHLVKNGLDLGFTGIDLSVFYQKDTSALSYLGMRGIRTHDIWHALLGLTVSPLDEYMVVVFQLAQFRSSYHMVMLASGLIHTAFLDPKNIPVMLDKLHYYYQVGTDAKFVLGYKFEENYELPLAEVRKSLGLPEVFKSF